MKHLHGRTPGIVTAIVAPVALGLVASATVGADTPPPAVAASVQAPSVANPTASAAASAPAANARPVTTSHSGVRKMFCLNMSMQCFAMNQPAATEAKATPTSSLDLRAPDIHTLIPEVRLREPLDEPYEAEQEQVQVQGTRPEVYVPGGLMSLPWAVMHPTQAWRIFLPASSAK
jgi:hypothetical protein